ncbi:hypothetical protein HNR46_003926 [Haloferula luteola]|uniref:Uncharacterized protein n=1 Tax=Haloferula luteola TaxID=595692 RepID=A0A840V6L6_9BACT|nr:hypothetical protein [Haloferula luteola]
MEICHADSQRVGREAARRSKASETGLARVAVLGLVEDGEGVEIGLGPNEAQRSDRVAKRPHHRPRPAESGQGGFEVGGGV